MMLMSRGQHQAPPSTEPDGFRWRRFALALAVLLMVSAVLGIAMAQGVLATSFAVSGRKMKVSAQRIDGSGYVMYPSLVTSAGGARHPVTVLGIRSGRMRGMCQSAVVPTPLGRYVLRLSSAPGATVPVSDLLVSASHVNADIDYRKLQINRDAASLDAIPGATGNPGQFGLQAARFTVNDVHVGSWAVLSSSMRIPGLRLALGPHEHECF